MADGMNAFEAWIMEKRYGENWKKKLEEQERNRQAAAQYDAQRMMAQQQQASGQQNALAMQQRQQGAQGTLQEAYSAPDAIRARNRALAQFQNY